jgi:uncharacterized protein (DUF305 family)
MVLIELLLMESMYENRKLNLIIAVVAVVAAIAFFGLIRYQTAVTDRQFLRSMIPLHAGAILMCEQAPIQAQEVKGLCKSIISGQESEIRQMRAMLQK